MRWQDDAAVAGFSTDGAPHTAVWVRPADPQQLAWASAVGKSDTPTYIVERSSDGFTMIGSGGQAIEMPTLPNLQEFLTSAYARGIDHPPPARILFHGFEDGQVDALLRTTRLRYASARPTGDASIFLTGRAGLPPEEIARQLHWQYKWDHAIVDRSSVTVRTVDQGPLAGLHEVSFNTQIIPLDRPPFIIRVFLYFSESVPEGLQTQILAFVDKFLATDATRFTDMDALVSQLHLKLSTEFPQADPKLHVNFDGKPRNREPADISISDAGASGSTANG
jgi:hypothetical protein